MTNQNGIMTQMDDAAKERFLSRFADFMGEPLLTKEETDEWLRNAGYDPEEIGQQIRACAEAALAEYARKE